MCGERSQVGLVLDQGRLQPLVAGHVGGMRIKGLRVGVDDRGDELPARHERREVIRAQQDLGIPGSSVFVDIPEPSAEHSATCGQPLLGTLQLYGDFLGAELRLLVIRPQFCQFSLRLVLGPLDAFQFPEQLTCFAAHQTQPVALLGQLREDLLQPVLYLLQRRGLRRPSPHPAVVGRGRQYQRDHQGEDRPLHGVTNRRTAIMLPVAPTMTPAANRTVAAVRSASAIDTSGRNGSALLIRIAPSAYNPARITVAMAAVAAPSRIPSSSSGHWMNQRVAPTSSMISISRRRAMTVNRIVFTTTINATAARKSVSRAASIRTPRVRASSRSVTLAP